MAKSTTPRDWTKAQPHHADTGKITTRDYADKHPGKVEWVKGNNNK